MALEPIFISEDIKRQLPHESEQFARIDTVFRQRMKQVESNLNCLAVAKIANIVEDMKEANITLEKVQKGLKDYLETKRLYFPRFFFLNDADLLSILAETKDPTLVQPHMGKAFEGIASVKFNDAATIIEAMISMETEQVAFKVHVDVDKPGNINVYFESNLLSLHGNHSFNDCGGVIELHRSNAFERLAHVRLHKGRILGLCQNTEQISIVEEKEAWEI
jgi:hypothetical protein